MNAELGRFKDELYTALFPRIAEAFPVMDFRKTKGGNRWESNHHLDGNKDSQGDIVTYVYENTKFCAKDHARNTKGLIDLYMELNNVDFFTALRALAELCNLTDRLPNNSEEWEEYRLRQENRNNAKRIFAEALQDDSEEAKRVRSYLYSRKWTDEEIKKAGLGLITTAIRKSLPDGDSYKGVAKKNGKVVGGVGTTHLLAIPFEEGSNIVGFKFREVVEQTTGTKYLNSYGLPKGVCLFGIGTDAKDVVLVEGELDALHAQVKGFKNIVATAGNGATETQLKGAIRKGVTKFTLLFDNDERGKSFIIPTINAIQKTGASIFVASIPDGYKDVDDYLADHTIEEFSELIKWAEPYSHYIVESIEEKYAKIEETRGADGLTLKDREDFYNDIERLINSPYIKPVEREDVYTLLKDYEERLNFKVADFRVWADKAYLRQQEASRAEAANKASTEMQKALQEGRVDEALKLMRETSSTLSAQEKAVEYAKVFAPLTPQEYATFLSEIPEGIPTGFKFEQDRQVERLTLNSGLTFICGYRGHGKTSFLNNIALNEARRNLSLGNGESVLYFSYEVDKRRLIIDLLNTFVNDADISRHPSDTILSFFKGQGGRYFKKGLTADGKDHYANFLLQKDKFLRDYLHSGALTIVEENYKVEELLDAIKYYLSTRKASIVCIDYAQLIYSKDYSRQRTEEIKKVVNDIKDFANKEGIPFVIAAQFNREIDSPISVDTKNIGEGGDFERIADTCIGLFNLKELHPLPKSSDEEKEAKKLLEKLGVADYTENNTRLKKSLAPIQGKLFVRLMKRRYGYYPLDTILEWEGRTKYIKPNDEEALSTEPKQGDLLPFTESEVNSPF